MDITVQLANSEAVADMLRRHGRNVPLGVSRGMKKISEAVAKKAYDYAPRSPTRTIVSRTLKVQRRSKSQRTPGGLEKSIRGEMRLSHGGSEAAIFVASTAPAGKYAKRIHDEKGKTWRNRGPGTIAKGPQADDKFIERAVKDTSKHFVPILEREMRKELAKP